MHGNYSDGSVVKKCPTGSQLCTVSYVSLNYLLSNQMSQLHYQNLHVKTTTNIYIHNKPITMMSSYLITFNSSVSTSDNVCNCVRHCVTNCPSISALGVKVTLN